MVVSNCPISPSVPKTGERAVIIKMTMIIYRRSLAALLGDLSSFMPNRFTMMSVTMSASVRASAKARIKKIAVMSIAMDATRKSASMLSPGRPISLTIGGTIMPIIQKMIAIIRLIVSRGILRRISSPVGFLLTSIPLLR